ISRIKKNITEFGHLEAETLEIIKSIENIDNKKLFDVMFGLFQQNNNVNNRVICKFIGKNSDRKIREYLLENVKNTGTPYQLKINSILALGAVKEQSIRDLIDSIYENHNEDLFIKQIALISISNIDIDFAFKKYLENPSREIGFLDLIYENLENIQNIKEIKNIEFLLENIENNEFLSSIIYQNDKSQIITALGKIGGHEAVIKLFEILTTDSQEILCLLNCEKAARELGKIGDKKLIPLLQKIYKENNDADLRSALLEAIWNLSGK
ncbi:MAG TPA: HEAT repeat domain-containing protein, partial [bacterium]|nr:HEAT repeat domain-containing protein [bacterium]